MSPMYEDYTLVRNGEELAVSASYTSIKNLYDSLKKLAKYTSLKIVHRVKELGGRVKSSLTLSEESR